MKLFTYNHNLIVENKIPFLDKKIDEISEMQNKLDNGLETTIPKDVLDSFIPKDVINPDLFLNDEVKPKIRKQLIKLAHDFLNSLELKKNIVIKDIIFTGSLANYNWSKFSDIDLHVVLDYEQFDSDKNITKEMFQQKKINWNENHDIKILNFPVEIYVQDIKDKLSATAIYSLQNNKWVKKPKKYSFELDKESIKNKSLDFIAKLKKIDEFYKQEKYQQVIDETDKLKKKIKNFRKSGLENGGELSDENIIFKVLRRINYMDYLYELSDKAYDKSMSLVNENSNTEEPFVKNVSYKTDETEDGFEINGFIGDDEVCSVVLDVVYHGFWIFEGDLTEEEYEEIFPNDKFMQIVHLSVPDKNMRGLGLAKKLVKLAIEKTKQVGLDTLYLNASPMGSDGLALPDLIGFYQSFGFNVFKHQGNNALMVLYINQTPKEINENKVSDYDGGVLFILGKELEDNKHRLFVTTIKKTLELPRKKTSNEEGLPVKMAVFGNNEVFRVGMVDGIPKPLKVDWKTQNLMLDRLGLTKTSVALNDKVKTPAHWISKKYNNIPQAIRELKPVLLNLPNIKWIN